MAIKGTRNEITIEGRMGKDPELKFIGSKGTALCTFSVATTESTGADSEKTIWHDVKVWQKLGISVSEQMQKGDVIAVYGYLDVEEWEDKTSGQKRRKAVIVARNCYKKIWPKKDGEHAEKKPAAQAAPEADPADSYADEGDVAV